MEKVAHFFSFQTSKNGGVNHTKFTIFNRRVSITDEKFVLFVILLLAAFLRIFKISEYMTFLGDEGRDVLVVYNILHGELTLLGPTSSVGGFFLGPIYYYFMAPFLFLAGYDPVGPAIMVALFGVATVYLVYLLGKTFFNTTTGIIASSLYAISPLVISYSRSSWNPNLMPVFTLLTLFILYKALATNNRKLFIISGILFGIVMQLHYVSFFVGGIIIAYIALIRLTESYKIFSKITAIVKDGLSFFIGFLIGWSPFLAFELRHGFPNLQSIGQFILHSEEVSGGGESFIETIGDVFFRLFGRLVTKFPPPEQVTIKEDIMVAVWYYLTIILAVSCFSFFILNIAKSIKNRNIFLQQSLLAVWFILGVIIFGFYRRSIYDYYFEFLFPLPFLFVGSFLSFLLQREMILRIISFSTFIILVTINFTGTPFNFSSNRQKDQVKQIADFVLDKADGKPFNFALITNGNSDHAYRYFMKVKGQDPVVIQSFDSDPMRKSVTKQLLIICEDTNCRPHGSPLWEVAGFGRGEIEGAWNVSVVKVYKIIPFKGNLRPY